MTSWSGAARTRLRSAAPRSSTRSHGWRVRAGPPDRGRWPQRPVWTACSPRSPTASPRPRRPCSEVQPDDEGSNHMCRWLAYSGAPVRIQDALYSPVHSLIDQSLHSELGAETTNGDGFGIGWYDQEETPGVFHSVEPAWN